MHSRKKGEIEDLARVLAETVKGVRPAKVRLRLVEPPRPTMFDSITRESCLRRIRYLVRQYRLRPLLDQETFDTPGIDCADDAEVARMLRLLEKAAECLREGIPLEDTGLIRDVSHHLDRYEEQHDA
jgi:hypothetical protein